MGFQLPA